MQDPRDVVAIERTHEYNGTYHVLHGAISPMDNIGPDQIRIKELVARLGSEEVEEVIMATTQLLRVRQQLVYQQVALNLGYYCQPIGLRCSCRC